jgi:hypothetical protein
LKKTQTKKLFLKVPALTEELVGVCLALSAAVFLGYFKYALPVVGAFKCPQTFQEVSNVGKCHLSKYWTNNGHYNTIFKTFLPLYFNILITFFVSLLSVYLERL